MGTEKLFDACRRLKSAISRSQTANNPDAEPKTALAPDQTPQSKGGIFSRIPFLGKRKAAERIGIGLMDNGLMLAKMSGTTPATLLAIEYYAMPDEIRNTPSRIEFWVRDTLRRFEPGVSGCELWWGLTAAEAQTLYFELPPLKGAELDAVAQLTLTKQLKLDMAGSVFDYRINPMRTSSNTKGKLACQALAAESSVLLEKQNLLRKAGLTMTGISARSFAADNLIASGWRKSQWKTYTTLYVSPNLSHITIVDEGGIEFRRTIQTGQNAFLAAVEDKFSSHPSPAVSVAPSAADAAFSDLAIASDWLMTGHSQTHEAKTVTKKEVKSIHREYSAEIWRLLLDSDVSPFEESMVNDAVEPTVQRLVRQVDRIIYQYMREHTGSSIEGIYVIASPRIEHMLSARLRQDIGLEAKAYELEGAMAPGVREKIGEFNAKNLLPLVCTTVGLACATESTPNLLMPPAVRHRQESIRHAVSAVSGALVVMSVAFFGVGLWQLAGWYSARGDLAQTQSLIRSWPKAYRVQDLNHAMAEVSALRQKAKTNVAKREYAAWVGELSGFVSDRVYFTDVVFEKAVVSTPGKNSSGKNSADKSSRRVRIEAVLLGNVLDREQTLSELIFRLKSSPLVKTVNVARSRNEADSEQITLTLGGL